MWKMGQSSHTVEVREDAVITLEEYASIPIAFEVTSIFEVKPTDHNPATFLLTERHLNMPYRKDYDSINGEHPSDWAKRFDLSNWVIFSAWMNGRHVGGAIVSFHTPELTMLEGRDDLAVLWDIRVSPEARHQGIGTALFQAVEAQAQAEGCKQLKIETQNINVAACRFYARQAAFSGQSIIRRILNLSTRFSYSGTKIYPAETGDYTIPVSLALNGEHL